METPKNPIEGDAADYVAGCRQIADSRSVFETGIGLMNRLKYPQKFALITILFLLPMCLMMYFFFSAVNIQVQFAQKELAGTAYLRPVRVLMEDALRARVLIHEDIAHSVARSEEMARIQTRLSSDVEALASVDQKLGGYSKPEAGARRFATPGIPFRRRRSIRMREGAMRCTALLSTIYARSYPT